MPKTAAAPPSRAILQIRSLSPQVYDEMRAESAYRKISLASLLEEVWEHYKHSGHSIWAEGAAD